MRDLFHTCRKLLRRRNSRTMTIGYAYPGGRGTCSIPVPSLAERGGIMSTYEEFMVILTVALLIVAILTYTHKK